MLSQRMEEKRVCVEVKEDVQNISSTLGFGALCFCSLYMLCFFKFFGWG